MLVEYISITQISEGAVERALANPKINDIEDGFQYYAADGAGCSCIVTENARDYYFSNKEIISSEQFLIKYAIHQ